MSASCFRTSTGAAVGPWRSACDHLDAQPASFDLGILAIVCGLLAAVRLTDALRRRRTR